MAFLPMTQEIKTVGQFRECDERQSFEYALRDKADDWQAASFPHRVAVGHDGQSRIAKVLKTVAYIAIDEDENGNAVVEKWQIRNHQKYGDDQ